MILSKALKIGSQKLAKISTTSQLDAEILLVEALKKSSKKFSKIGREYLYSHPEDEIGPATKIYQKFLRKRARGVPIAYITGHKEFFGFDFLVSKSVLIPRPETEILIEETLKIIKSQISIRQSANKSQILLADIGTGCGNIIISLATTMLRSMEVKNPERIKFYATDISEKALRIAQKNARHHKVFSKIKFYQGDLFKALPKNQKFDLICANLPYLKSDFKSIHSISYEPRKALDGGKNGLEIIERLLKQSSNHLKSKAVILLEINPEQILKIKKIACQILPQAKIKIIKDLSGSLRIFKISLPSHFSAIQR